MKLKLKVIPAKLTQGIKKYAIKSADTNRLIKISAGKASLMGGAPPVKLPFTMEPQVQTQWCWAATSTSISLFYNSGSSWTQCLVAEAVLSSPCCTSPAPCNKPWYLDEALTITGNFVSYQGPVSFAHVENELSAGRIIACRVQWRGGGGHFVVIYGCQTVDAINFYSIDDPITGKANISESGFLSAYRGTGSWTHTFITKP